MTDPDDPGELYSDFITYYTFTRIVAERILATKSSRNQPDMHRKCPTFHTLFDLDHRHLLAKAPHCRSIAQHRTGLTVPTALHEMNASDRGTEHAVGAAHTSSISTAAMEV
jgi:hypothetical protein